MAQNKKGYQSVTLGPDVPLVPLKEFTEMKLTTEQWHAAWELCGPSVIENLRKPQLPLWKIIASAYLEGLEHGYSAARKDAEGEQ